MKKTLLSFLLCSGLFGILVGCFCRDIEPYWNPTTVQTEVTEVQNNLMIAATDSIVSTDSLGIHLSFEVEYLALQNFSNPFISSAHATSCVERGHKGMKDELTAISVTSNADFNNIAAGQSLNSTILISNENLDTWVTNKEFNHLVAYMGSPNFIALLLTEKPTNNARHDFKITLDFASGRTEVVQTGPHTWN